MELGDLHVRRLGLLLPLIVVSSLAGCVEEIRFDDNVDAAIGFLELTQNVDGGFPSELGGLSDFSTSCWVALALDAGGGSVESQTRLREFLAGRSGAVERNETGSFSALNAVSLYVLAGLALDVPQARWNRTDPLARLRDAADNSSLLLNERLFLLGALGRAAPAAAAGLRNETHDRLLGLNASETATDAWFRSIAILALLAAGESSQDRTLRDAARSLLKSQKGEGGFRSNPEYEPDASTTAMVVSVLAQVQFVYAHERETGMQFLEELQQPDGSVRFSHELDFSRVKTTAEAVLGWTGRGPFGSARPAVG